MSSKKKPTTVKELYTGYLLKSPAPSALSKNTTSEGCYQLTYHENHERRDKPLRVIDISKIILLFIGPEAHQKWDWIQKNCKCSPSSVLLMKVEEDTAKHCRDYFLIGENSDDVNGWFNALFEAMKTQQSRNTLQGERLRSTSEPVHPISSKANDRRSPPKLMLTYLSRYRNDEYPRKLSEPPVPISVFENTDKKDRKQDESPENSSVYMSMVSVEDHRDFKQSVSVTGSCASTELDNSETHTHVEEIGDSQNDLEHNVISAQEEGKPWLSQWHQMQNSRRDRTLSQETVEGIQKCLKRLSKDEAKLLFQRYPGLNPNPVYQTEDKIQYLMQILSSQPKY
ncbi:pleckstrin -like protein [Labeo rohita]|uniref:Pleckstrin-like protein n=1 Tax=Labeo rohita TaxID=84645 RepID=A0A498LMQ9_LABRO|nr:pleckstrin -like protein [Labeo rohita]